MSEREEQRINIRLTAVADCKWCGGKGIKTTRTEIGPFVIGGKLRYGAPVTGLCSCVRSEVQP